MRERPAPTRSTGRGFVLLTTLVVLLLLGSTLAVFHVLLVSRWRSSRLLEAQLRSRIVAENGIQYAAALLPDLEPQSLLLGPDGRLSCSSGNEWRSPVEFATALRFDPDFWTPPCDDGLPAGAGLSGAGRRFPDGARFFLRFSNDPAEPPEVDRDRILLVRSLGIVPTTARGPVGNGLRNAVSLIEARYRIETAFLPPSPITLLAPSGEFQWDGDQFSVEGGDRVAVASVIPEPGRVVDDLLLSLSAAQRLRLVGAGQSPSVGRISEDWARDPVRKRLFSIDFWESFTGNLADFDRGMEGGLTLLRGGSHEIDFSGFLVTRGDVTIGGSSRLSGILLHIGPGLLKLQGETLVEGGIWIADPEVGSDGLSLGAIRLGIADRVTIRYQAASIRSALAQLPATRLGWRMIFPEMIR